MAFPLIKPSFALGEMAPGLLGRVDLQRYQTACGTLRNWVVKFQGGAFTRAGTKFCGFSKQTGRNYPPRMITYQQSITQGLALEFGHHYMRVIENGAYVLEGAATISNISQTNPAVVTYTPYGAITAAVAINTAVTSSYAPAELVTIAGGTFTVRAVLAVTNTKLLALVLNSPGTSGYVPADTLTLTGGTQSTPAQLTVAATKVVSATVAAGGAAGAPGTATVTGTTGTGTKFQASVTIDGGGVLTAVNSITVGGSYTVNPAVPANEPVTGGGLVGAQLAVSMGINTFTISNAGVFTANPAGATFTQNTTSGVGVGATFRSALMGINAMTVSSAGSYSVVPANPAAQFSTSGSGFGATYTLTTAGAPFANGDWVFIRNVVGMTEVNGETYVVGGATATTFELYNVYGEAVSSINFAAYISGGQALRIYTATSPYQEEDLQWLKWTQNKTVMSFGCLNQETGVEYALYDLQRVAPAYWTFTLVDTIPTVSPPTGVAGSASAVGTVDYQYVITSVSPDDGSESVASAIIHVPTAVDIASTAGSIKLTWTPVSGVQVYNVYKAQPGYAGTLVPVGAMFGFAGQALGGELIDSNIVPDFQQVPPKHKNPFARGQIIAVTPTAAGAGYTSATATVTSGTGSGAVLQVGIVSGGVAYIIIDDAGRNYAVGDTVVITGDGAGATAVIRVGPSTGTFPSVPAYFQQRRFYANSLNLPDTYWGSQPGAYSNFDSRIPTVDSDSITGTPWAVQINGIQFMLPMPGGLMTLTGLEAWLLGGTGGSALAPQPITPSSQQAVPQAFNGCHNHVPPVKIDQDIIYVQAKGSNVRNIAYNLPNNIYTGLDLTLNSSHLFLGQQMIQMAWCEEPYKVLWVVREDGILLSLTYLKAQEVQGWARHDTLGEFVSLCSVTELPVDALYVAVARPIGDHVPYMIERMNDRIWSTVEDGWCVDCGLALAQAEPIATIFPQSARGAGIVSGATITDGGAGYSAATTATVVDDNGNGPGSGAVVSGVTVVGGVITAVAFSSGGTDYTYPAISFFDPEGTGSGATAVLGLDNTAQVNCDAGIFSASNIGDVIRVGGGILTILAVPAADELTVRVDSPIVVLTPNSGGMPAGARPHEWTITRPVTTITNLTYLAGATVTGLYDGKILPPQVVPANGQLVLPEPASQVVIGLPFVAQLQTARLDPSGGTTSQGQRKDFPQVTMRVEQSRDLEVGTMQVDGANLSPSQIEVDWVQMKPLPNTARPPYGSDVVPLFTGDVSTATMGGFAREGQVAIQQRFPVPASILAAIPDDLPGDEPEMKARSRGGRGNVDE